MTEAATKRPTEVVLVVEDEVLARTALAEYLRHCGYRVIEAAALTEAKRVLTNMDITVHILFSAIPAFELVQWVRQNRPAIRIVSTVTLEKAAKAAGDLCEDGPGTRRPYEPQQVIDWIKKAAGLRA